MSIDPLFTLAHTMVYAPGTQAILLGSGVSRSAQILTGWEVTIDLVRRLAVMEGVTQTSDLEAWYTCTYGKPPDYSDLLLSLAKTAAERRSLLQSYFEPTDDEREAGAKLPTAAHRAIARLVAQGFVRVILTTNFDRLMETALREEGIEPVVVSTADSTEGAAPIVHQRCLLVKIHGDYLDDRIKNTEAELRDYDPRMDQYLDRIFDEFGLIICGWSGEWDPALRAALERCKSRRYTTTWVTTGKPRFRAAALISLRNAQVAVTTNADSFFISLAEKVTSVSELKTTLSTSIDIALATLKRYLAEERHLIRLEDMVFKEINDLKQRSQTDFRFDNATQPTAERIIQLIQKIDAQTELLRVIFFHGCRMSKASQESVFVTSLSLLAHQEQTLGPHYRIWLDATKYPSICILYSGALGALVSGNWNLLHKLLLLHIHIDGIERIAADQLAAYHSDDLAQHLFSPNRHHTPASDHLAKVIVPLCVGLRPEPELLFDELEVWVSLAFLDATHGQENRRGVMPPGRYIWRSLGRTTDAPNRIFSQADRMGMSWQPIKSGWFGGRFERWQEIRQVFTAGYTHHAKRW